MGMIKGIIIGGFAAILVLLSGCEKDEKAVADLEDTEIVEKFHQVEETVVDDYWSQPIDSELCKTLGECRDLGDTYGSEHFADFRKGLERTNEMWYLNVGTEVDIYDFNDLDWDDEELIIARYEIIEDELVLTRGEEASIFKGVVDIVHALYDRNKVNFQIIDFRENVYPHVDIYQGKLMLPSDEIAKWFQIDMVKTLIHEYGHMLTYNEADFVSSDTCPADQLYLKPYEMCYSTDSYMNLYYQALLKEYEEQWLYDGNPTVEKRIAFYENHKDSFVTTYATVNLFEDIAESFSYFILTPYNDRPQTIPEEKVNFFYQFPELIEYRAFVLKELKERKDEMWSFY
ncbi:hypothetical protein [Sporosarcina highlanderae]|uniref:Lipoprotein n=1 Tax=Sporosarcina highlanderae TaxID=3035916 RepID=A0ABT8JQC0_9BACL|nr:hypothetical protein [Sporosarcina highlanderae]MDN4607212.1 hypothetical protein [Sporosarcina highlanderae]